jgi:hypothetical protein
MKDVHHHRQVRRAHKQRALGAAAVEVTMPGVQRHRENRLLAPHSKLRRLPSVNSTWVDPLPSNK